MQISDIKVGEKYMCGDGDVSMVTAIGEGGSVTFTASTGYVFLWAREDFAQQHSLIEPTKPKPEPEPKSDHTKETRTALTRLGRAAEIVRLLDGLDRHETTSTLLAVADALHCPIREMTARESIEGLNYENGEPIGY